MGISAFVSIVYLAVSIVTSTEPGPLRFAVNVNDPVTKNAVADRSPCAVTDTVLPRECSDAVSLAHLENVLPFPVAVIDIESPEPTCIVVSAVIEYTAVFIVTATEPVPSMFT